MRPTPPTTARSRPSSARRLPRRGVVLCALVAASALVGCAHGARRPATTADATRAAAEESRPAVVLVLPVVLEAGTERDTSALDAALQAGLVGGDPRIVARRLDEAMPVEDACSERASCLRTLGATSGVDYVLTAQVVVLGTAAIVRARLVDVDAEDGEVQRQQSLDGVTDASLAEALAALGDALGGPLRPAIAPPPVDPRPRRMRIGIPIAVAGAAALSIGLGVGLRPERPDVVIVPP